MDAKPTMWQGIAIVSLIIAVVALIMPFVIPAPAGSEGPQGPAGIDGTDGADGDDGVDGTDGTECWDINENGVGDIPNEDKNGDGIVDVRDCRGLPCWDLNRNGVRDLPDEDTDGNGVVTVRDCKGLEGETGPAGPQGATGPTGPQGPQGPAGPGTIMAYDVAAGSNVIGSTCTLYVGGELTMWAPSSGYIVLHAMVQIHIGHAEGVSDKWVISIGESPSDCDPTGAPWNWEEYIPSNVGTFIGSKTGFIQRVFRIDTQGLYDFYIVGYMSLGASAADEFYVGQMTAVFYPD